MSTSTLTFNQEIAQTILGQIKHQDFWALGAWGVNRVCAVENGVQFRASGSRLKQGGVVTITLNGSDLYDIEVGRIRGNKYTVVASHKDVFFDMLVELLDEAIG